MNRSDMSTSSDLLDLLCDTASVTKNDDKKRKNKISSRRSTGNGGKSRHENNEISASLTTSRRDNVSRPGSSDYYHGSSGGRSQISISESQSSASISGSGGGSSVLSYASRMFVNSKNNNKQKRHSSSSSQRRKNHDPYPSTSSHQSVLSTQSSINSHTSQSTLQSSNDIFHNSYVMNMARYYIKLPFRIRYVIQLVSFACIIFLVRRELMASLDYFDIATGGNKLSHAAIAEHNQNQYQHEHQQLHRSGMGLSSKVQNGWMDDDASSAHTLYSLKDSELFTNLQSMDDIDTSIEYHAQNNDDDSTNKCNRLFIYLPDSFATHGHGSQINTYVMSIAVSTYLNRALVLLEPPISEGNQFAGGSQFGCPIDAFHEAMGVQTSLRGTSARGDALSTSIDASWSIRDDFPLGFSRLVQHPAWLSHGCSVPKTCSDGTNMYDYKDWEKMYHDGLRNEGEKLNGRLREVRCINADGSQSNVVVTSGGKIRQYFRGQSSTMTSMLPDDPEKSRWATNLGATPSEAAMFASIQDPRQIWDYVLGLMNKAGFLKFQPWIARDVGLFLKSFDIPFDEEYSAIHVRRGDKLAVEARSEVERYWKSQGYTDTNNLPTDYVPFAHYLSQWDSSDSCTTNDEGDLEVMKHNVYIATDDPIVVRQEIDALANHVDVNTILWNDCHELTFYFNPTDSSACHLNGDGEYGFDKDKEDATEKDSCFARYHRNIASIADMMILSKARTFIGEYNSNWGRVVRTMRVRLNDNYDIKQVIEKADRSITRTLDTRVAWGSAVEKPPGI